MFGNAGRKWRWLALCAFAFSLGFAQEKEQSSDEPSRAAQRELDQERDRRYEARFEALEEKLETAVTNLKDRNTLELQAATTAVLKAEAASEKRFESINEFRATLSDQQRMLITKNEADVRFAAVQERIELLQKAQERWAGQLEGSTGSRDESRTMWALVVSAIAVVVSIAIAFKRTTTERKS